ncbi:hypothetical protein PsorP6_005450 [Peronosclerospora sorghi]|uniref:Uncharacterized protein n=1 Tax=Peronosclerospora sorghi TaxID=230839 RepID=A0ACC0W142_9STRA|nr:hypothetical protein PsorP6_005450 [Peronosclerospora sorghi]
MKLDPFRANQASILMDYIERLPPAFHSMQWMNAWPGEGDTRGNMVYASLQRQPEDFEKVAFVVLGSLRAFPNQQFRKLQWALLDDILPWANPCVEIIVRQSLYQVGVLTDELSPQLLWKTDMFQSDEGLERCCDTLKIVADKLTQTPRSFESVPLLSELAGFVSQYAADARVIVKTFAAMARTWAKDALLEYMEESAPLRIAEIRQKDLGAWDSEAAQEVCELIVLFRTSFLCASINVNATEVMLRIESMLAEVMSRRIAELVNYLTRNDRDTVLTGLVHLLNATSPEQLEWNEFSEFILDDGQFGSCFEAFDESTSVHYSINVFTGIVLTDGYAPGGLPVDIRQHKRFVSLFGHCNFEVFSTNGVFRTERKYFDRLYDFALEEEELFIQELCAEPSGKIARTLQLCSIDWVQSLRPIFQRNYEDFIHIEAKGRQVYFVATFHASDSLSCFKVPFSDHKRPYDEITSCLSDYDWFVKKEKVLVDVFSVLVKLEDVQFLYALRSPAGVLKIELPRFKLMFCLNNMMQLESEEHKGFALASQQQFDDFLPRFSRYLVLMLQDRTDTSRSEVRVLVPVGSVQESTEGMIDIAIPGKATDDVDVACYDIHRRLKTLETETIAARLQLAAVCARAGTSVPSKRLQMTGTEAAVEILRACRSSRPFSASERDMIVSICKWGYCDPAVKILAVQLLMEADRLAFLFGESQRIDMAMSCRDEKSEYQDTCARRIERNPLRLQFRSEEETIILGHVQHASVSRFTKEVEVVDPLPVVEDYVPSIENELRLLLRIETDGRKDIPPFPLNSTTENA